MDALFATFTGQNASSAAGPTRTSAGDASVFDSLLAAAGVAPVTPVPPVTARAADGQVSRPVTASHAGQASTAIAGPGVAQPGQAGSNPAAGATLAGADSTIPTASATDAPPAGTAVSPVSGQELPDPVTGTQSAAKATGQTTGSATQTAASTTGSVPAQSAHASVTGKTGEVSSSGTAGNPGQTEGKAGARGVATAPVQQTVSGSEGKTAPDIVSVSGSASQPATNPAAPAQTAALAQQPAAALPVQAQAGVQARREADSQTSGQSGKSAAKPAGVSGAAAPAQANQPAASAPQPPATGTPPNTPAPDMDAALPRSGGAEPMAQGPQGDRATPPPVSIDPGSAPESETETADMAQLRAAEASRTAERPGAAAGSARFTPANAGTLAAQIASRFQQGERRFEIRMDPPELGRVEVKMHVTNDNRVHAVLSADRPETLQDMRQHIRELERALADAGLDLSEDGLSFELSQGRDENDGNPSTPSGFSELAFAENADGEVIAAALPQEVYGFQLARSGSVDVRL